MTIKRDILGTVIEIKLSEQEVLAAHRAYLEQELGKMSAPLPQPTKCEMIQKPQPDCNPKLVVAVAVKEDPGFMVRLKECANEIANTENTWGVKKVLSRYEEDMLRASQAGMTGKEIAAIIGVSDKTTWKHIDRVRRRNVTAA